MPVSAASPAGVPRFQRLRTAWLLLCLALAAHVADEALTGFLGVYNPTVEALRAKLPWFPMPQFAFGPWIGGLIAGVAVLLSLSRFVSRGDRWARVLAYLFAVVMVFNAAGHTLGTIFGRTVESVRFARPMPWFYSSPFLLAAALNLLYELRRSRCDG